MIHMNLLSNNLQNLINKIGMHLKMFFYILNHYLEDNHLLIYLQNKYHKLLLHRQYIPLNLKIQILRNNLYFFIYFRILKTYSHKHSNQSKLRIHSKHLRNKKFLQDKYYSFYKICMFLYKLQDKHIFLYSLIKRKLLFLLLPSLKNFKCIL